jgi:hypothetical protein
VNHSYQAKEKEMRKRGFAAVLMMTAAVALVFSACGPKTVSRGDAPDWYLNPPTAKDKIYGTGASDPMASVEFAKKVADYNAQQALSQTIQVSIQSMLRTYLQQSGTMDNVRALQFAESVGKQVVNMTLTGVVITKRDIKGGKCFSLAELSMDTMKNALLNSARDAAAEYSELKAKSAFDALDKEINKGNIPIVSPK